MLRGPSLGIHFLRTFFAPLGNRSLALRKAFVIASTTIPAKRSEKGTSPNGSGAVLALASRAPTLGFRAIGVWQLV